MRTGEVVGAERLVIDLGATDAGLAQSLADAGCTRYLGLVPRDHLDEVRSQVGERWAPRFHPLLPEVTRAHSADVLVVRHPLLRLAWSVRDTPRVRTLLLEHGSSAPERWLLATVLAVTEGARRTGVLKLPGGRFDVVELPPRRMALRPRRYLSPAVGVAGLGRRLAEEDVRHAVLRWFEELPAIEPGEDLDLLVADADLARLQAVLDEEPGTIPVDVYSESGLPGADFRTAAYYPPPLARGLLERSLRHPSGVRVPAPEDHLASLAYHAVYHKGPESGLPSRHALHALTPPDHDYAATLGRLADEVGAELEMTLEGLDVFLGSVGWRPPADTLRRLAPGNPWITAHVLDRRPAPVTPPTATTFLLRERALAELGLDPVLKALDHFGFVVLLAAPLDAEASRRCAAELRGGNWGPGPFPVDGGPPRVVVAAAHYSPRPPDARLLAQYPRLENAEVYFLKRHVREMVRSATGTAAEFNPLHSSDDEEEAWEYLTVAVPDEVPRLRSELASRREAWGATDDVVEVLSRGRRARVEVVRTAAGPAVRKTYVPEFERHLRREVDALRVLGPRVAAVPRLLGTGPDWFETPLFRDDLAGRTRARRLLPLDVLGSMVDVLRRIHEHGYELVDAKPDNFVLDPVEGLKVVDLEFLHHDDGQVPAFRDSLTFHRPPEGFGGDLPVGELSYEHRWLPYTGMPVDVLVSGSVPVQRAWRLAYRLRRATVLPGAPPRRAVRRGRDLLRALRRRAAWGVTVLSRRRAASAFAGTGPDGHR